MTGEEQLIDGVVDHFYNKGTDQIDTCTIHMMVDDRKNWKNMLKRQKFQLIRTSDSYVEFRGKITECRFETQDRYNLTLKVVSEVNILKDLPSHVTVEVRPPQKIASLTAGTIVSDEETARPGSYVSEDNAVLIVPGDDPASDDGTISAFSSDLSTVGVVGNLSDDDPDTTVRFFTGANVASGYLELTGTSPNAKASIVGVRIEVLGKVQHQDDDQKVELFYWDYDAGVPAWVQIGDDFEIGYNGLAHLTAAWVTEIRLGAGGYTSGNPFVENVTDAFKFRIVVTPDTSTSINAKIQEVKIEFYTDARYTGAHFPITSYAVDDITFNVNVDPEAAGVNAGDTFTIGWKDSIALQEIFDEYSSVDLPFNVTIDGNFTGYSSRSFLGMSLMDCVHYFIEKQQGHFYFDHDANTLQILKESTMLTGTNRTLTPGEIETATLEEKYDSYVRKVIVYGATYRRGDGEEITVRYTYPGIHDPIWRGTATKIIIKQKPDIKSWTEVRDYATGIYTSLNSPQLSISIILNSLNTSIEIGDVLDLTTDDFTLDDDPIVSLDCSHDVGNDLTKQTFKIGFTRTKLAKRHSNILNQLSEGLNDLHRYGRTLVTQHDEKLLRADGYIAGSNITIAGGDLTGITNLTLANNVDLGAFSIRLPEILLDGGLGFYTRVHPGTPGVNYLLYLPEANDTLAGLNAEQIFVNKTLTLPVIGSFHPDGAKAHTLTFPQATDTLIARGTTDTLTNKTWQGVAIAAAYIGALPTSKITSGEFDDARIKASNVTQHQAVLAVKGSLLTDSVPDARVPLSAVSQHQASLAVKGSLLTDVVPDNRISSSSVVQHQEDITGLGTLTTGVTFSGMVTPITIIRGDNNATITKHIDEDSLEFSGDLIVQNGSFSANSIMIGNQVLSETGGHLHIAAAVPGITIKDIDSTTDAAYPQIKGLDENNTLLWGIGSMSSLNGLFYIQNYLNGENILLKTNSGGVQLDNGAAVNDIDTVMAASPTDTQLLTAQAIAEICMISSTNAAYIPCVFIHDSVGPHSINWKAGTAHGMEANTGTADMFPIYQLTIPTNLNGYELHCNGFRLGLADADPSDYVYSFMIYGITHAGSVLLINNDNSGARFKTATTYTIAIAEQSLHLYNKIIVGINTYCSTADELDIASVELKCYYTPV